MAVRLRLWLVMLPLLAVSVEGASTIVDHFAPKSYEGAELFARSSESHGLLPYAVGAGATMLLCALVSFATTGDSARRRVPVWVFSALPACAFAIQEHVEFAISHGQAPWTLATTHSFLLGLALQVPFGIVAILVARGLIHVSTTVGALVRSSRQHELHRSAPPCLPRPRSDAARRPAPVDTRRLTRGPPALTAV